MRLSSLAERRFLLRITFAPYADAIFLFRLWLVSEPPWEEERPREAAAPSRRSDLPRSDIGGFRRVLAMINVPCPFACKQHGNGFGSSHFPANPVLLSTVPGPNPVLLSTVYPVLLYSTVALEA